MWKAYLGDNQVARATKGALVADWEPNEYLPEKQLDMCQRLTAGRGQCDWYGLRA